MATTTITVADAKRRLQLFNQKVAELSALSFMTKASQADAGVSVKWVGDQVHVKRIGADKESTSAFALTLRLFLQPRDGLEIHEIERVYQTLPIPGQDKYWVTENLKDLDSYLDGHDDLKIVIDGEPVTIRAILETFLYGDLAHVNEDKRLKFEKWQALPIRSLLENKFEIAVCEVMRFLCWLAMMNDETIKRLEAPERSSQVASPATA